MDRRIEDVQKEECLLNKDPLCRIELAKNLNINNDQQASHTRPSVAQESVNQRHLLILNVCNIFKHDENGKQWS